MGANGQIFDTASGALIDFILNDLAWAPLQRAIADLSHVNRVLPTRIDGLLGYQFLAQYKTAVNVKTNELYLWDRQGVDSDLVAVASTR